MSESTVIVAAQAIKLLQSEDIEISSRALDFRSSPPPPGAYSTPRPVSSRLDYDCKCCAVHNRAPQIRPGGGEGGPSERGSGRGIR